MKRVVIVGLGRFGGTLACELADGGWDVLGLELDRRAVDLVKRRLPSVVEADGTDEASLRALGAERAELGVVAIGESLESTILALVALREIGVPRILARARNAREARILEQVGASATIQIEAEQGRALARRLLAGEAEENA